MSCDSADSRQRILLVTVLLGAGKTTALRVLEDLGYAVDDHGDILPRDLKSVDGPAP